MAQLSRKREVVRLSAKPGIVAPFIPSRLRGLAWFGDYGNALAAEDAQKMTFRFECPDGRRNFTAPGEARELYMPCLDDDAPIWEYFPDKNAPGGERVGVLCSEDQKIGIAVFGDLYMCFDVGNVAALLHHAMTTFSIDLTDVTSSGKMYHPFRFELLQNASLGELRRATEELLASMEQPSELWTMRCQSAGNEASIAIFSCIEAEGPLSGDSGQLIFEAERMSWDGPDIPHSAWVFWWHSARAAVTGSTRRKPRKARVRVVLTP